MALAIVLDTNVLLSGIAYPTGVPGKIVAAWRFGAIDVVLSGYILEELRRVMPRLVHRHGLASMEVDDFVDSLAILAELVEPLPVHRSPTKSELRDKSDDPVLGTLLACLEQSRAAYLVTGDRDLLALARQYPILTPAEFWSRHGPA